MSHLECNLLVVAVHRLLLINAKGVLCLTTGARSGLHLCPTPAHPERPQQGLTTLLVAKQTKRPLVTRYVCVFHAKVAVAIDLKLVRIGKERKFGAHLQPRSQEDYSNMANGWVYQGATCYTNGSETPVPH